MFKKENNCNFLIVTIKYKPVFYCFGSVFVTFKTSYLSFGKENNTIRKLKRDLNFFKESEQTLLQWGKVSKIL